LATPGDGANPQPLAFEDALAMLDEIVCELEDGRIGLAEALARYEEGVKLLKDCYELLAKAERRIELLSKIGPAGEAVTTEFDDSPSAADQPAARPKRRVRPPAREQNEIDEPGALF
jgi:exodeoxyribonuclease VII small subunit